MVSLNFIAVDIQAVKALLLFVSVPFFFQLEEGNQSFEDDAAVVTQRL